MTSLKINDTLAQNVNGALSHKPVSPVVSYLKERIATWEKLGQQAEADLFRAQLILVQQQGGI